MGEFVGERGSLSEKGECAMYIASYSFMGIGAVISCALALGWIGVERKRCMAISLISGVICTLTVCLNMSVRISGILCLLFLAVYLPIIMQPNTSAADVIAADAIACACYGTILVTIDAILQIDVISFFFRIMIIIILLISTALFIRFIAEEFPGAQWQEYFTEQERTGEHSFKKLGGICCYFIAYSVCLCLPAVVGHGSYALLALEWFAFFSGLRLVNQLISNRREEMTILMEKQYRDDMQNYMSVIRSQRHDYNFHVQTLHGLLLQKDYEGCEKYLNELMTDSIKMNQLLPLHDAAISALILSFQRKGEQRGIHMEIAIENDLSQIATNVYETNKVIGNLLQNAIDETDALADKSYGIKLSILKRGEFCIINVSNRTRGIRPMAQYQAGSSSKTGHEGIGLASIQALVSGYGGVIYSRMENDIIYFIAKIPLCLLKGEA